MASVASVGFALSAIPIGIERGWITPEEGYDRALGSINTMLTLQLPDEGYFMYHWINMETGERWPGSEISVIDSAIAINGAICAGEYFGGEVKEKAEERYSNVNWSWYVDTDKKQFYMGYDPVTGFSGHWDFYAEQLQMYALTAAAPTKPVDPNLDLYNNFTRHYGTYGSLPPFINSWFGSVFTYQYSFCWFDFKNKMDKNGVDWWRNSTLDTAQNFTGKSDFRFAIKTGSDLSLLVKFEDSQGTDVLEKTLDITGNTDWQDELWSITDTDLTKLTDVKKILFLAAPGETTGSGTFYIDDVQFCANKPIASNVIISGKPYVGQTLKGFYNYYDTHGMDEGTTIFSWYRASDKDGEYEQISGSNSKTFTVTNEDVDKYIKLVITPSTSGADPRQGDAAESIPVGKVEVSYPVAKNVIITKEPVDVEAYLDNFDGDRLCSRWVDSGDKVYTITYDSSKKYDGNSSLKVDYNKNGSTWGFLVAVFDNAQDLSTYEKLQGKVYGNTSVLIKYENAAGQGIAEKRFDFTGGNIWQDVDWDISSINGLENVKRIMFFFAPGSGTDTGTANLDSFKFVARNAVDVTTNGTPTVGETLYSSYDFYVVSGDPESGTSVSWHRSDAIDGEYAHIDGANSVAYKPSQEDVGKYLKLQS